MPAKIRLSVSKVHEPCARITPNWFARKASVRAWSVSFRERAFHSHHYANKHPRKALHISRFRLHALQKAKRVERANGDQFEAHHMCFTQRQLFEHFVSDGRIGDVDDERHARLSL